MPGQQTQNEKPESEAKPDPKTQEGKGTPAEKALKQMTQAEYDAVMQKVANYDLIANDPELAPKIMDHYRAKTGKARETPKPKDTEENVKPQPTVEIDDRFKAMARRQAELELKLFKKEHPDFDTHKDTMAKLLQRHPTMELEEAYSLSKGSSSKPEQRPEKPKAEATAETNQTAAETESSNELEDVEKRINDPKATPHMDDAIALAYAAAKNKSGQEESE
jgi:hypothetical protein